MFAIRTTLCRTSTITRSVHTTPATTPKSTQVDHDDHNTNQVTQEVNPTNETPKFNEYSNWVLQWNKPRSQHMAFDDGHNYQTPKKTLPSWGINHGEEY